MVLEYNNRLYNITDYENMVKLAIETNNIYELVEHSGKLTEIIGSDAPSAISLSPDFTIESWLEFLNRYGSEWAKERMFYKYIAVGDYDMASWTIECFVKGLEQRNENVPPILYYQIGYYKYMQVNDDLPLEEMYKLYGGKILSAGQWYKKAVDAGFDYNEIAEGKWCIDYYNRNNQNRSSNVSSKSNEGCYIATAVYGSYDCPEVWTLRRFRDEVLYRTFLGKTFIKTYYRISPGLVKKYGDCKPVKNVTKVILDYFVKKLNDKGINDSYYVDK